VRLLHTAHVNTYHSRNLPCSKKSLRDLHGFATSPAARKACEICMALPHGCELSVLYSTAYIVEHNTKSGPCKAKITVIQKRPIRSPGSRIFQHKCLYNAPTTIAFDNWNSDQSFVYLSRNTESLKTWKFARFFGSP
jgi:hypothetical protein